MRVVRYSSSEILPDKIAPLIGNSFFGSAGFADLWRPLGGKPVYWVAEESERIQTVLPGVEFGMKPLKRFYAMPDGCYGRLFHSPTNSVDRNAVANRFLEALRRAGYMKLYIYDYHGSFQASAGFDVGHCRTMLVDLSILGWQPFDKTIQSQIRTAGREGIRIERFNPDRHFAKFLALMESTERRHGRRPRYPPAFFKQLARLGQDDRRVHWIWCEHDGKPAASHIYFIENDMALNWQVYYDKAFSFLKPNQYMLFTTVQKLARQGVRTLNLGASPDDASGLIQYKQKLGGRSYYYNCYQRQTLLGKLV